MAARWTRGGREGQPVYSFSNRRNSLKLSAYFSVVAVFGLFLLLAKLGTLQSDVLWILSSGGVALVCLLYGSLFPTRMSFFEDYLLVSMRSGKPEEIPYGKITRVVIVPNEWSRSGYFLRVAFYVEGRSKRLAVPKLILYHDPRLPNPQLDAESLASWVTEKAGLPQYEDPALGRWSHSHKQDNLL